MQYRDFWQMELEPAELNKLLNGPLSYRVVYLPSDMCPCLDTRTGSADPGCAHCQGRGRTWHEPGTVERREMFYRGSRSRPERLGYGAVVELISVIDEHGRAYPAARIAPNGTIAFGDDEPDYGDAYTVTYRTLEQSRLHARNIRAQRAWVERGEVQHGDMDASIPTTLEDLVTPNPAWLAKEHDLFVFPDLRRAVQQHMRRGRMERLTYRHLRSVSGARALVGGQQVQYVPGEDFAIIDGVVSWLTDGPSDGYILDYQAAPEMYVFAELPQQRHINGEDLPRRVALRLFELYPGRR